ncbi:hypothetical protein [Marinactinospora rubrisoli]|uniref:Uncharacterized protein n=1 Tax=Marinactinospora rubrisoli TaxID=2715399 RepID=A0ABW2KPX8_9ACTN
MRIAVRRDTVEVRLPPSTAAPVTVAVDGAVCGVTPGSRRVPPYGAGSTSADVPDG